MQNDKLLPCPFCGAKPHIYWEAWQEISAESGVYKLKANHSRECFFVRMNGTNTESEMISNRKEHLVEIWNTRKPMEQILESMEDKREEILHESEFDNHTVNYFLEYTDDLIEIVRKGGVDNETN